MKKAGVQVKGKLVSQKGTVCVFECPSGHKSIKDFGKGPVPRRVPEEGLKILSKHWAKDGVYYPCKACWKAIKERLS